MYRSLWIPFEKSTMVIIQSFLFFLFIFIDPRFHIAMLIVDLCFFFLSKKKTRGFFSGAMHKKMIFFSIILFRIAQVTRLRLVFYIDVEF